MDSGKNEQGEVIAFESVLLYKGAKMKLSEERRVMLAFYRARAMYVL